MTEVRVLCIPLEINDGGGIVDYPTQYEPYFHSLGSGWKLSSFNQINYSDKKTENVDYNSKLSHNSNQDT